MMFSANMDNFKIYLLGEGENVAFIFVFIIFVYKKMVLKNIPCMILVIHSHLFSQEKLNNYFMSICCGYSDTSTAFVTKNNFCLTKM